MGIYWIKMHIYGGYKSLTWASIFVSSTAFFVNNSSFLVALLTAERMYAVFRPLDYATKMSIKR